MKSKRQIPGWSVLVAALLVALAAAAAITSLRQQADKMRRAESLLLHIEGQANRLSALEWQAIAKGELAPKVLEEVQATRSQMQQQLDELVQIAPARARLEQFLKAYREYIAALDEEFRLIAAGQLAQALIVDEQRVDPGFDVLSEEIADVNATYSDITRRTLQKADTGSALTLISAAMAIGLLFWRFNFAQRNAQIQLVRAEQRVLSQSEERFRSLVQNASDVILILDIDITIYYASASVYRILNYHPKDWIGTNVLNWVHPNDAPQLQNFFTKCLHNPGVTPILLG